MGSSHQGRPLGFPVWRGQGSARSRGCWHWGCPPHACAVGVPEGCCAMHSYPGMCRQQSLPMPIHWSSPAPQNSSLQGIALAPLAEGLERLGWVQPCHGGCTPGMGIHHSSPSMAKLGVPADHATITSRGQGVGGDLCRCLLPAHPSVQAAQHHCSQRAGAAPVCGHPGSGNHCQSHRLCFSQRIFVSFCLIPA